MTILLEEYAFTFRALVGSPSDIKCIRQVSGSVVSEDMTYVAELPTVPVETDVLKYTVDVNEDGVGGTVTVAWPSTSSSITIYRETSDTQGSDYEDYNQFPSDTVESDLDKRTMVTQEIKEVLDRSLKVPITSDIDGELPAVEGGKYLGWNAAGTAFENKTVDATPSGTTAMLYLSNYASYAAALTAIGTTESVLVLDDAGAVSVDTTIPITLQQVFTKKGALTIAAGMTLTINGAIDAGLYQIFSGTGTVKFGVSSVISCVESSWFGAIGDTIVTNGAFVSGTAADVAINAAIVAAQGLHAVHVGDGTYKITDSLVPAVNTQTRTYTQGMSIYGNGYSTVLVNVAPVSNPTFDLSLNRGGFIKNISITGVEANPNTAIDMDNTREFLIENVSLDPMGHGIYCHGQQVSKNIFRNINIWWDAAFWGTTDIEALSNTNNYDGISFISTAGQFTTQQIIDGLRVEGGRYGIYATQETFGNSIGFIIRDYINANTDRGIFMTNIVRVNVDGWYINNSTGGDYASYFDGCAYVSLRSCRGDYGTIKAYNTLKFVNSNANHLTLDNIYTTGNLEFASVSTTAGISLNNVYIIGTLTDQNIQSFRNCSFNNLDINGSALVYGGTHAKDGSTILNAFGTLTTDNDDTPSVLGKNNLLLRYVAGHTITNFDDGIDGQEITIMLSALSDSVIVQSNATIALGADQTLVTNDIITFVNVNGVWLCKYYQDNTP